MSVNPVRLRKLHRRVPLQYLQCLIQWQPRSRSKEPRFSSALHSSRHNLLPVFELRLGARISAVLVGGALLVLDDEFVLGRSRRGISQRREQNSSAQDEHLPDEYNRL